MKHLTRWKDFTNQVSRSLKKASLFRFACVLAVIAALIPGLDLRGQEAEVAVFDLMAQGKLERARLELNRIVDQNFFNEERLYLAGLLAERPDSAYAYFRRAVELAGDCDITAQALTGMAQYHLAAGSYAGGLEIIDRHQKRCRKSESYPELVYWQSQLMLAAGVAEDARKPLERALDKSQEPGVSAQLMLALGDVAMLREDYDDAAAYYRELANSGERYAGMTVLRLITAYQASGDDDMAQFANSVLADRYPGTLGFSRRRREPVAEPTATAPNESPQGLYAIRVGTFSRRTSAERLQEQYRGQGYTVQITLVQISGRKYYVVDVGRFQSREQAGDLLDKLESRTRGDFHIVTI
jgi:cell division septation protein DedD